LLNQTNGRTLVDMAVVSAVDWVCVDSGLFRAVLYRLDVQQLYLRFRDGNAYRYFDCPESVYKEFVSAESKGRYFSQHICDHYQYEMIHRKHPGGSAGESLEEQLSSSVQIAKARSDQKREDAHAAGVHEAIL
jgi:KTSC domain